MAKTLSFLFMFILSSGVLLSCKSTKPYNPYLDMKTKPGEQMRKDDKKHIKKGNRAYKKKELKSRKHLFGRKRAPKD